MSNVKDVKKVKEIYCGCIKNDGKNIYEYKYSTIKVENEYAAGYIVDKEYCTSNRYFTKYLNYKNLDTALKISKEITCMYSTDRNKIVEWLSSEREKSLKEAEMKYNSLKESVIGEVTDVNAIFAPNANEKAKEVKCDGGIIRRATYICPHCEKEVENSRPDYGDPETVPCEHCSGPIIWTARWDYSDIRD